MLPTDATPPLRHAIEARLRDSDARVSRLSDALDDMEETVRAAFRAGLGEAMRHLPASAAPMAARALRTVILEVTGTTLDEEQDAADGIRAVDEVTG